MKKRFTFEAKLSSYVTGEVLADSIEEAIEKIYKGEVSELVDETDYEFSDIAKVVLDEDDCEEESDDICYDDYDCYLADDNNDEEVEIEIKCCGEYSLACWDCPLFGNGCDEWLKET